MNKCDVSISSDLVKGIIDTKMREAITDALGRDPTALINAIVETAMKEKNRDYENSTVFQKAINQMIRDEAQAVFKKWLSAKKPLIKKAILKRLKIEEAGFVDMVADKLVSKLGSQFYVSVSLKVED